MADRNVKVTVRADVADFKRGMDAAAKSTEKVGTAAQATATKAKTGLSGLAQSARDNRDAWTTTGGALTAYGAAVTGLSVVVAKTGIEYNTLRQRSVAALTTLTGSAEAAMKQMDRLDDFASNSPFSRSVFIEAQQQLIGFGMEAEKVIPTLDAIQNAVAATGGSNQDIAELVRIIAQVGAAGKITATDLMQFGQRGVDAATLIGSQMGMTGAQIRDEITAGTLGADDAIAALVAGMDQRFGGAAANVKGTMLGALDRVKAAFRDIAADAMAVFVDPTGGGLAVDGLNKLADALRAFEDVPGPIRNTALALGSLSGLAAGGVGAFFLMAPRIVETRDALKTLATDMPRLSSAMGGLSKAVVGGAGVAVGLLAISSALNAVRDANREAIPGIEGVGSALLDLADTGSIDSLDSQIENLGIRVNGLSGMAEGPITDLQGAFSRLADPTLTQRLEGLDKAASLGNIRTSKDDVLDYFRSVDGYLSQLVQGGNAEQAASLLDQMWQAASGAGMDRAQFEALFSGTIDSLQGVENDARLAAGGFDVLGESMLALPEGMPTRLDSAREAADSLAASMGEAGASFVNFAEDANNAEVSLDAWLDKLLEQAAARDKWVENMRTLARAGLEEGFYNELLTLGPDGALRVQQMVDEIANGRDVSEFNAMGRELGMAATQGVIDEFSEEKFDVVTLEADLDAAKARQAHTDFLYGVKETPGEVPLEADDAQARADLVEYVSWLDTQVGIVHMDANDADARQRVADWNAMADAVEGVPKLNADPRLAQQELRDWLAGARGSTGTSKLDANDSLARGKTSAWKSWASLQMAVAKVGANDWGARNTVGGLVGWINNRWATVNVTARMRGALDAGAGLGFSNRASGGIERRPMMMGPGYGPTNVILAGEPETRGEAFISNHPAYRRENEQYLRVAASWFDMDVVKKAYAAGGVASRFTSPAPVYSLPVQGRVSDAPVTHDYSITIGTVVNPQAEPATRTAQRQRQRYSMRGRG